MRDRQNRPSVSQTNLRLVIGLALLSVTSGCRANSDPNRLQLQGTVGRVAPLIGGSVYELQTPDGTYTVRSARRDLQPGQALMIEGRWQFLDPPVDRSPVVTEPTAPARAEEQPRYIEEQLQP